jgi:hypothetical protein
MPCGADKGSRTLVARVRAVVGARSAASTDGSYRLKRSPASKGAVPLLSYLKHCLKPLVPFGLCEHLQQQELVAGWLTTLPKVRSRHSLNQVARLSCLRQVGIPLFAWV